MFRFSTFARVSATLIAVMIPFTVERVEGGGLIGDLIEGACGGCGAGRALDDAHRGIKEALPPYKAVEEGATHLGREATVETAGPALAAAIRASRNDAVRAGTSAVPRAIRDRLINFFPSTLLDRVSYRVGQGHELSVQANSIRFGDADAVTLEDVIVFASSWDAANDDVLWAHELTHVKQYDRWGLVDFAKRYVRSYTAVEDEAYAAQSEYAKIAGTSLENARVVIRNDAGRPIVFYLQVNDGDWDRYQLEESSSASYRCNGCLAREFGIRIRTEDYDPLVYRLDPGTQYQIAWNDLRRMWDVFQD